VHVAVREVSLTVGAGEVYALLGLNGAGKTTLLEAIQGHRAVSEGTIRVFGGDLPRSPAVRARVGVMLQESALVGDLTPRETIELLGRLSGRSDDSARIISVVGLQARADTRVNLLSGGERRRLDFGVAIYGSPELLFLDEPTAGLDPSSRRALWDAVMHLRDEGTTVILTTHYLQEAEEHASRIGILNEGVLVLDKPRAELIESFPSSVAFRTANALGGVPLPIEDRGDGTWTASTADAQADVYRLLTWAKAEGITLEGLEVRPCSLEQLLDSVAEGGGSA
jgi:ABC-2 type transport system ATP-binding protein